MSAWDMWFDLGEADMLAKGARGLMLDELAEKPEVVDPERPIVLPKDEDPFKTLKQRLRRRAA